MSYYFIDLRESSKTFCHYTDLDQEDENDLYKQFNVDKFALQDLFDWQTRFMIYAYKPFYPVNMAVYTAREVPKEISKVCTLNGGGEELYLLINRPYRPENSIEVNYLYPVFRGREYDFYVSDRFCIGVSFYR